MASRSQKSARPCANPLFEKWLTEWRDVAASRNMKTKYVYDKALSSLRKYPLLLRSGKEAKLLEFFGDKICDMLDRKVAENKLEIESAYSDDASTSRFPIELTTTSSQLSQETNIIAKRKGDSSNSNATKKQRQYIPEKRSGPYALILTLYKYREKDAASPFMKKDELMAAAQPLCDTSFSIPNAGSHYTAWSSMASLIKKGLVSKEGKPTRFSLTDEGAELVIKMLEAEDVDPPASQRFTAVAMRVADPSFSGATLSSGQEPNFVDLEEATSSHQPIGSSSTCDIESTKFALRPRQFQILLVVDNCETQTGGQNERKKAVQTDLRKNGVNFDVRKLNVGDFMWIAREKVLPVPGQLQLPPAREIALDFIVERKRKDDLSHSIMDGRFKEQKYRLKNCGLRRPIYLVEEYGQKNKQTLPESTLLQAVANTQIIDGFTIKYTKDQAETVAYLTLMTRCLQSSFNNKVLWGCNRAERDSLESSLSTAAEHYFLTFNEFNNNCVKNKPPTVTELFAKQLFVTPGLSADRVQAIVDHFPTPSSLFKAYDRCTTKEQSENLLADIKYGKSQRKLGPASSKLLFQFYNQEILF